jgi:subtilisin family serine protease
MKTLILVLIIGIGMSSCKKLDAPRELPSETSKANDYKFYNEESRTKYPTHEKGVVLFKLKNNSSLSRVAGRSSTERVFTKAMEKAGDNGFYKIRIGDEIKTLADLKKNPDIEWASLNYTEVTQGTPDDPYWNDGSLYGMTHIGMQAVWQSGNFGSKNVVVGVIDEGIFGHEDLCQNIWTNPHEIDNGIDDDGNGYIDDFHGWDWFNGDNEVYPGASHGTHVAGTIGAKGGNQKGVIGVNSNITLISCKFLESYGYDDNAVKAIDYLIDLKTRHGINIKVTSNSWGGGGYNPGLLAAIRRARDNDILFVAAAGNSGSNNDAFPNYPCNYDSDNIISVGASDWQNNKASFSCFGATTVDIFAPGVGIISTVPTGSHTSGYAYYSGTSMATPHVSGVCALYAGINPEAGYAQIKSAILNSASKLPQLKGLCLGNEIGGNFLNASTFTGQTVENQPPFYECPSLTPDVTPPTIPQNFEIYEVGFDPRPGPFYGGYIGVRWERSTDDFGVAGYLLWLNGNVAWFLGGNQYVIAGLDTTQPIIAWVHAQDTWGNVSGFSNRDTATWDGFLEPPPDLVPPTVPQNFDIYEKGIDANGAWARMTWNWSTDPEGNPITYNVWMVKNNGAPDHIGSVSGSNLLVVNGLAIANYKFWVVAEDSWHNKSAASNTDTVSFTNTPPVDPPTPDIIPPVVNIANPPNGYVIPQKGNKNINIQVSASDNVGVVKIQIFIDGVLKKECLNTTSCNYNWKTGSESNGQHTITAKAFDAAGNKDEKTITVIK